MQHDHITLPQPHPTPGHDPLVPCKVWIMVWFTLQYRCRSGNISSREPISEFFNFMFVFVKDMTCIFESVVNKCELSCCFVISPFFPLFLYLEKIWYLGFVSGTLHVSARISTCPGVQVARAQVFKWHLVSLEHLGTCYLNTRPRANCLWRQVGQGFEHLTRDNTASV